MEKKLDILINNGKSYIEINSLNEMVEEHTKLQKHCNGYAYDSLMYRYQFARIKLAYYEAFEYSQENCISYHEALSKKNKLAQRDIMRFGQILDEVMKEHD